MAALLVARPADPSATQPQDATALDAGASIERHVAIGEEHLYRITLAAGQYAEVIVEQRGIDVVVRARREGGADDVEFQEEVRRNGQERVDVVADKGGVYVLAIAPSHGIYSGTYAIRLAARRVATDSGRSMYEARRLRTTALALATAGRFDEARPLLERAVTISEAVRGRDDVFTGMLLHDLVGIALETRDDRRAEPLQRRALAIFDKAWGDGHPYSAMARVRIAVLLHNAGDRAQAEELLRPAMQLVESTLGAEHAWFATCLRAQGMFRSNARDLDAAEAVYGRAMAILAKVGATETTAYTAVLNNLGLVYMDKRDLARAEEHYQTGARGGRAAARNGEPSYQPVLAEPRRRRTRPQGVCEGVRVHDARTGDSPANPRRRTHRHRSSPEQPRDPVPCDRRCVSCDRNVFSLAPHLGEDRWPLSTGGR